MKKLSIALLLALVFCPAALGREFDILGDHDKPSPIYRPGEKMVFTVTVLKEGQPLAGMQLKWTRTGDDGLVETGEAVSTLEGVRITTSTAKPGFVRIVVTASDEQGKPLTYLRYGRTTPLTLDMGACVAPEMLRGLPAPEDFDAFWASRKQLLATVPLKVLEMVEVPGNDKVRAFDVKVACAGAMPVSGYLVMPLDAKEKSLPAVVEYHGYGIRSAAKNLRAGEKAIYFNVNAHGIPNGREAAYYRQLGQTTLKRYALDTEGNSDREKTYFHDMMLRVMRSLEFVKSLPEWNGRDLTATGGSQGGMQSITAAALDHDVTHCYAWSPWNCDIGREKCGRLKTIWGPAYTPALEYYDPINHASRADPRCTLHIVAGLGDYTCPPAGVWIAYTNFPGPKKLEVRQANQHLYKPETFSTFVIEDKGPRQ